MEEALLVQAVVPFGVVPIPLHRPLLIPFPVLMAEAVEIPVAEEAAATGNSLNLLGYKLDQSLKLKIYFSEQTLF